MVLTKEQKKEHVALGKDLIKNNKSLIFADFSGVSVTDLQNLKSRLREVGGTFKIIKKRLLKIALDDAGINFDPTAFKAPVGTIFGKDEMTSVAGPFYKFAKELIAKKKNIEALGAYDGENNAVMTSEEFMVIAKLPSREILLAQVMGGMASPVRAFLYILSQLAEKGGAKVEEEKPAEKAEEVKAEPSAETPAPEETKPEESAEVEDK